MIKELLDQANEIIDEVDHQLEETVKPLADDLMQRISETVESHEQLDTVFSEIEDEYGSWYRLVKESVTEVTKEVGREGLLKADESISEMLFGDDE